MTAQENHPPKLPKSARALVKRLGEIKTRFSPEEREEKLDILDRIRRTAIPAPGTLRAYHELLLFIRAYPDDEQILELVLQECDRFGARVARLRRSDAGAASKLDDSGIAGTPIYYRYEYATAVWLVKWFGDALEIDWDELEETEKLDTLLPLFCEWVENDGLDLGDISVEDWIALRKGERSSLDWLLENLKRAIPSYSVRNSLYDSVDVPVVWQLDDSPASRTHGGAPCPKPFFHRDGMLRRIDDFSQEIARPLSTIRLAPRRAAERLIRTIRTALAVRHRSLYPVDYASREEVFVADVERGYQVILYGIEPRQRLPIESDYAFLVLKNGLVFGYGVGALLFEQVELALNIFETFRGGESALVLAQVARVFRNLFGSKRFKPERYQVGYENEEGLKSGAFWFYYRLGFVPKDAKVHALARKEQAKINRNRSYRSSLSVLEKLATSDLYLTLEDDGPPKADDFPLADLSLKVTGMIGDRFGGNRKEAIQGCTESAARVLRCPGWRRWPADERESFERLSLIVALVSDLDRWPAKDKRALAGIMRAKGKPQEAEYVRLMLRHERLRAALERIARG
ncbi:MAG: hypothetical protein ABIK89_17900 [Planctomycetota bacterium]